MPSVRFLITTLTIVGISGCASAPPAPTFDPADSKALNIMNAAGMSANLEDVEVPKDTITSITDSKGYGFAMVASGYSSPLPGLSSGQMAGLNMAAWLLSPKADTARNSYFAWMPATEAGANPEERMADILLDAATQAVKEMGYTPKQEVGRGGTDKSAVAVYLTNGDGRICKDSGGGSNCWISFATREPTKLTNAKSFVSESSEAWFFDPTENVYSYFYFSKNNTGLNELDLLVNTSKHLPAWVHFYVAPNQIKLNEKDKLKIPVLVNKGEVLYFVKAKE